MQVNVGFAFNASAELNAANALGGVIKVLQVAGSAMADEPVDSVQVQIPWSAASNSSLPQFSATCWFSGKSVALGRTGADRNVPLGLIASSCEYPIPLPQPAAAATATATATLSSYPHAPNPNPAQGAALPLRFTPRPLPTRRAGRSTPAATFHFRARTAASTTPPAGRRASIIR